MRSCLMKSSGLNGSAPFAYDTELDDGVNADKKQKFRRAQGGLKGAARGVYGSRLEYNPPWRKSYLIVIDIISCTFHVAISIYSWCHTLAIWSISARCIDCRRAASV